MKKSGFTLPELLITVAIIAIVAAITAPMMDRIKPDKNKIKVLNYYASITEAVNTLLDNNIIYHATRDARGNFTCHGLGCTNQPLMDKYATAEYAGANKFRNLMRSVLKLDDNMTDANGTLFIIDPLANDAYRITIDLNTDGNNCPFDPVACPRPDRFSFHVSRQGEVRANDSLTYAYIQNPTSRDKKADYNTASRQDIIDALKNAE